MHILNDNNKKKELVEIETELESESYFANIQRNIKVLEDRIKNLKEIRDTQLAKLNLAEEGRFLVGGCIITKSIIKLQDVDKAMVRAKLPEAISEKLSYKTLFTISDTYKL